MQYFNDGSADGFVFVSDIGHKLAGGAGVAEFNAPSRSNICNELSVAVAVGGLPGTPNKKTVTTIASNSTLPCKGCKQHLAKDASISL